MLMYLLKISFRDGLRWATLLAGLLFIGGCGSFFEKKTTELQTREILRELEHPREIPGLKNLLPEIYRQPPEIIPIKDGFKLFYFTKHHSPEQLADMIKSQFGKMTDDAKGNTFYATLYPMTYNLATNQLVVTCPTEDEAKAILNFIELIDVPPIQVNIDCIVVERFADVTLDWETTILIENLLGEKITLGAGKFPDPAFPGAALREGARRDFGLDFGFWKNQGISGHQFRAVVDLLVSRGYLKILMNPQIETVNGQPATILSRENVPLQKIIFQPGSLTPFETTEYQWVADSLEVTPHVYADGSIGLKTKVQIGSKSKPEGVIQISVITERTIDIQENRIKPGESLVIGGLRKSEKRSVIRGIPFFQDIPIIGVLFSSKDFEEKATEVIFILTPSISSGGIPYEEMLEDVKKKHETPDYPKGLEDYFTDPLGSGAYSEQAKKEAQQAELERRRAEIRKAEAMEEVKQVKTELVESSEEVMTEKAKAAKALSDAKKAQADAQKAKAEAEKAAKEAEVVKNALLKAQQEAEAAKKEADKAKKEAQEAKEAAEKTRAELEKEKAAQQQPKEQPQEEQPQQQQENQENQTNSEQQQ